MNLMTIILWVLYPLSPMKRVCELARRFLAALVRKFQDEAFIGWLCANPDDPESIAGIELCLDDLNAIIDLMIYEKAREFLGLRALWKRPRPSQPQPRRSRTFAELCFRLEACMLRFADIERLAMRRAQKLARLLDPSEVRLAEPAHASFTDTACASCAFLPLSLSDSPDGLPRRSAAKAGGHAGSLGARAPPHPSPPQSSHLPTFTAETANLRPNRPSPSQTPRRMDFPPRFCSIRPSPPARSRPCPRRS